MQCPNTLKLRDMFIWLLINTWAKNKIKIEIFVHLTLKQYIKKLSVQYVMAKI